MPWWGAVLIAATFTVIGFAFDAGSGNKELGFAFAAAYVIGCILAVLAVRQSAIFTAVIQPPLLLFIAVPGAYFSFHGATFTGIKDLLINCGYPLIERFPLMFFTSAAVLLIGMARWYYGASTRQIAAPKTTAKDSPGIGRMASVASKLSAIFAGETGRRGRRGRRGAAPQALHRTARPGDKTRASQRRSTRSDRPVKRAQPSRSRHARPPETEIIEPVVERPRRSRSSRHVDPPPVPPGEPRRRRRPPSAREPRKIPPPVERRSRYEPFDADKPTATELTTRSRGCATAAPTKAMTALRTAPGPRAPRSWEAETWEYDA